MIHHILINDSWDYIIIISYDTPHITTYGTPHINQCLLGPHYSVQHSCIKHLYFQSKEWISTMKMNGTVDAVAFSESGTKMFSHGGECIPYKQISW